MTLRDSGVTYAFFNKRTNQSMTVPPPDEKGFAHVYIDGVSVMQVQYSEENGGCVILPDGKVLAPHEFAKVLRALIGAEGSIQQT